MCASPSVNAAGSGDAAGGSGGGAAAHMPFAAVLRRHERPRCGADSKPASNPLDGKMRPGGKALERTEPGRALRDDAAVALSGFASVAGATLTDVNADQAAQP